MRKFFVNSIIMASICIYCGSSPGKDPKFSDIARRIGELLAKEGHTLIYGGGNVGLMGIVADAVLAQGGQAIGVIPENLFNKEVAHLGLTKLHRVSSMHERKNLMASLADGFIALPGGVGTLEEISEAFVWTQLGLHLKPCALLNVSGFYDPLIAFLNQMVNSRFLHPEQLSQLIVSDNPETILEQINSFKPIVVDKWLDKEK